MKKVQPDMLVRYLRSLAVEGGNREVTDQALIDRFARNRDEAAFSTLVHRHGPLVWGVCRRNLPDAAAAEDAFQATFVVLSRKAGALRKHRSLANWLHGVARRTALKARTTWRRRQERESRAFRMSQPADPLTEITLREAMQVLDEELARLPDRLRAPVVLCCLEGRARDEAAQELGWSVSLVKNRLEQGRATLRARLTRRGLTLPAGLYVLVLSEAALGGQPPARIIETTVASAAGEALSPTVAALTQGVLQTMLQAKSTLAFALLFAACLICFAVGALQHQATARPVAPAGSMRSLVASADVDQPAATRPGRIYLHVSGGGLHSVQPDGSDEKSVIRSVLAAGPHYQLHSARLSPDGSRLAFGLARIAGNGAHPPAVIRVTDIAKPGEGEVLADLGDAEIHRWVWSPDGKRIAFSSWDMKHIVRNWIVEVESKKLDEIKLPIVKDDKIGEYQMTICDWSPDGKSLLVAGKGLHLVNVDGNNPRRLTPEFQLWDGGTRFSPDGKRVLYLTWNPNRSNSLYVVDVPGGKPQPLVEAGNFMDMRAAWSPDSKRIAYAATSQAANGERGEETSLFVVDADGKNTVTLRTEKHEANGIAFVLTDWR